MLYPVNMDRHAPSRSLYEYLCHLYDELDDLAAEGRGWGTDARAHDIKVRIDAIEEEISARGDL